MKRQRKTAFACGVLAAALLLTSCSGNPSGPVSDQTVKPATLPSSGNVDWNSYSSSWTGTGKTHSDFYSGIYYDVIYSACAEYQDSETYTDEMGVEHSITSFKLTKLKNKELQARINEDITENIKTLSGHTDFFEKNMPENPAEADCHAISSVFCNFSAFGNLLNISVHRLDSVYYSEKQDDGTLAMREAYDGDFIYTTYDLMTGEKLLLSDLFVNGVDLGALLNPLAAEKLSSESFSMYATADSEGLMRPFRGLPENYPHFILTYQYLEIYFPSGNPYIEGSKGILIPVELISPYLSQPSAELSGFYDDDVVIERYIRPSGIIDTTYPPETLNLFGVKTLNTDVYTLKCPSDPQKVEKVNEALKKEYEYLGSLENPGLMPFSPDNSYSYSFLNAYASFLSLEVFASSFNNGDFETISFCRCYDLETGRAVPLSDVTGDKDQLTAVLAEYGIKIDDYSSFYNYTVNSPSEITVYDSNGFASKSVKIYSELVDTSIFEK